MYAGFPESLLESVACPRDGGPLHAAEGAGPGGLLQDGTVTCAVCRRSFPLAGGILRLLTDDGLEGEARHEQQIRDDMAREEELVPTDTLVATDPFHGMEVLPTLESLHAEPAARCLEIGCGRGRYTEELARTCEAVVAVDFSLASLQRVAERMTSGARVGLVQADATAMQPAARPFERMLNTLHSNLPSREHRDALQRFAAASLADTGRYVFSTHNYGWRERRAGLGQAGRYEDGGMFRYLFTAGEIREETTPWFGECQIRPIVITPPLAGLLRLPRLRTSRLLERVPGMGPLAALWLVIATGPRRTAT